MYKTGDELKYISSVVKRIKPKYSKVVEVINDDKGHIISLQNAMKLRFVSTREGTLWDTYRLVSNGDPILVEKPD